MRGQDGVDVLDEIERLAVEQHVFLLDAERVRIALSVRMVEDAAGGLEARSLTGDRRGINLLHVQGVSPRPARVQNRLGLDLDEPARIE